MKLSFTFIFCLLATWVLGQAPAYQANEVDSMAMPRGGADYLNLFFQANLRKPIQAQAEGLGGRIILTGIAEPDGRISDAKILRSLRPDVDREALRVFQSFNAWKPARKSGAAVRQVVVFPYIIPRNAPFAYINKNRIEYFGEDKKGTADTLTARYRQETPLDSMGVPNGDMVIYRRGRTSWSEENRLLLIRERRVVNEKTGKYVEAVGYKNGMKSWINEVYDFSSDGELISRTTYENGRPVDTPFRYFENGVVSEMNTKNDGQSIETTWYKNGQIHEVRASGPSIPGKNNLPRVLSFWSVDGRQRVKDGRGDVVLESTARSCADSARQTRFIEEGSYVDGKQQGLWTGRYQDGSFDYEEMYDNGVLQSGKARRGKNAPVAYTTVEQMPEFPGGMAGLGRFLASNLRYPAEAQKSGQSGRVIVSFVVCTDGTLCDYKVVSGVSSSIDEEAVRVVTKMSGKWKPGSQRGEPVRVKYMMPVNFTLQ